jgi:eukaryotic-like serine/threonine-protein kinase
MPGQAEHSGRCPSCGTAAAREARFCAHCGTRLAEAPRWDAPVPERLARLLGSNYGIVGELGRGGFAVVYSVRDQRLNRYLAVKVMRPDLLASPQALERFRREARIVASPDHPNILPVSFAGEAAGLVWYAMPRVRGQTLRERLRQDGALPVADAQRVFVEVGRGLHYAHEHGVVHRDVKPANIMLEQSGKVMVLDFGIAKALSANGTSLSLSGIVIGSLEYMSPEQAAGSRDIDPRSDIYSLGVVAYEMVTGQTPEPGDRSQPRLIRGAATPPPDVRVQRPETPPAFARAIARCMEWRREARWATAAEAVAAVTA